MTTTAATTSSSYIIQMQFAHALAIVRAIPQNNTLQSVTAADKLQFYGLYKQATEGDVNIPRPSSRQIVDYAKWKAWSRMKGMTPIEAQKLYVHSLIQLLTELMHRYPRHEQSLLWKTALDSLEFDHREEQEQEELFQDAYDDTEYQHFLNHIEPQHIMDQQDILLNSPPPMTPLSTSLHHSHRHNSFSNVINSSTEYPITPITSPGGGSGIGENSVTGQWLLNQLQHKTHVHPMDLLQQQQQQQQPDLISEADTCDREVAATTANLFFSSPRQSPYSSPKKQQQQQHSTPSSTSSSHLQEQQQPKKKSNSTTRALEKLQTEVTALTEQIDRMRRESVDKQGKKQTQWMKLLKTVMKYLMVNSVIFSIIFYILWKKKSPITYKIINAIMPWIQLVIRNILRQVVFWKITV